MIDSENHSMLLTELKQRNQMLERENGRLAAEVQELRVEMGEIRALLGNAPDLIRILNKNVSEIVSRVMPKGKG